MRRRALLAQTRAETMLQLRRGENLIVTLAIPLGILVFFAKVDTISGMRWRRRIATRRRRGRM